MPTIGFEISDQHTLLELAAEGLGLGVSTRTTVQAYPDLALWAVELADAPLRGQAVVTWSERGIRTKAVQAMVQHAQGWAQESRDSARAQSSGLAEVHELPDGGVGVTVDDGV